MNVEQLIETVKLSYSIKRPVLALSSPGVGKSSSIYQAARKLADQHGETFGVIEVRASTSSAAELGDIKYIVNGEVSNAPQGWIPTDEKIASGECLAKGIVFLDEISDSTMTVQSALQQLLLDRRLGSVKLAKGWHTVAASNRQSDKAAAGRLSTALANRCIVVTVEPDTDCFVKWGLEYGIISDIIAFCRWKRNPWNFNPASKNQNPAFCSPRSMEILSDILKYNPNPYPELVTGTVGDGIGSEVLGFLELKNELPDLNKIIRDPDSVKIPSRMDVCIATLYALIARIEDKTVMNIVKYIARNQTEVATMAFKDLCKSHPSIITNKDLRDWMIRSENFKLLSYDYDEK